MANTRADVVIPANTWVDLYASTGITVGTAVEIINKGLVDCQVATAATAPATNIGIPVHISGAFVEIGSGEAGLFAYCAGASTRLVVREPVVVGGGGGGGGSMTNYALETGGNLAVLATASGNSGTGITQPTGGGGILGWLSGIYNKLNTSVAVTGTFYQATQPVSAASLPLPAGAALESGGNLATVATGVGVKSTASVLPTGGTGILGWLSGIYSQLKLALPGTTASSSALPIAVVDPTSGQAAAVQVFHNADNQALPSTAYGVLTGGVDQLINGSGNLDRKRGVSGDGAAATGLAAEVPLIFNGTTYDRVRGTSGAINVVDLGVHPGDDATFNRHWGGSKANYTAASASATIKTTQAVYYGLIVTTVTANAILIRDGGSGGAIVDTIPTATPAGTVRALPVAISCPTNLYVDFTTNTATGAVNILWV